MLHDFRHGASSVPDDRGPAGERFGHHDAERLLPLDQHQQRGGPAEKGALHRIVHRADIVDPVTEIWLNSAVEVLRVLGDDISCQNEPSTGRFRHRDGIVRAL